MNLYAIDISVLIPTYNRPVHLFECLESIKNQTKHPLEVIVIDASPNLDSKQVVENYLECGFKVQYYRTNPDKIEQRNFGVSKANGKLIQLSDDDIVFDSKYFEVVEDYLLVINDDRFGGFIGSIFESKPGYTLNSQTKIKRKIISFYQRVFFIYPFGKGKLLKSGQHQIIHNSIIGNEPIRIDVMGGGGCYLRKIFNHFSFDNNFRGYAAGEDVDFSLQIGTKYKLYYFPKAVFHHKSIGIKNIPEILKNSFKQNLVKYLFKKYQKVYNLSKLQYLWARLGIFLLVSLKKQLKHKDY